MIDPTKPETWPPLLRATDIVRDDKRGYPGIIPVTRQSWHAGVAEGLYPASVRLGFRLVAWRKADILKLLKRGSPARKRSRALAIEVSEQPIA
jgi:prophage regulatory protein